MSTAITKPISADAMETVLVKGDLAKLTASERLQYYQSVCESLGLNPLTQPFAYISLNGKLTLYAKRDCTDQLRKINNISIQILSREVTEGCYVVTANAKNPQNRQDESLGAVPIDTLKGEARSNAMMKAETKAKRRVTLSICGLAFLDESELESVHGAPVTVDATGEITSGTKEAAAKMAATKLEKLRVGVPYAEISKGNDESPVVVHAKVGKKTAKHYDLLQAFQDLKKRFKAVNAEATYYKCLGETGYEHSNEFPDTPEGLSQARGCYKWMSLELAEIEAAAQQREESLESDRTDDSPYTR